MAAPPADAVASRSGDRGARSGRLDAALLVVCATAAACLAAAHAGNVADAAHDAEVARAMGLLAAPWRALDAAVASLLVGVPLGTRAMRAELGVALAAGAAVALLFRLARSVAAQAADAPRLGALAAAIATLAAVCAPAWQMESAAVGGSAFGALLALAPLAVVARADEACARPPWRLAVFCAGLALGHEVLVGACGVLGVAAVAGTGRTARKRALEALRTDARGLLLALAAGLVPLGLALARVRIAGLPLLAALRDGWAGELAASHAGSPAAYVKGELGVVLGAMAVGGAVVAAMAPRARALGAGLLAVTVAGLAAGWAGAPLGPTRFGAPVLAAAAAACALAGLTMQAVVRAIAEARLPMAQASAALVLVLELVIPVDSADEALLRTRPRAAGQAALWDDVAWGALPPRAVVVVSDARLGRRAAAAAATGSLRGDVAIVRTYAQGFGAERALAADPALVPLWRDLALEGSPSEASLSSLATARPLVLEYEPRWGRVLGKHLVAVGLLDRFEPEPRGTSDRRKALDQWAPRRERLARAAAKDPELAAAAAYPLRARVLDVAASGDRDRVGRAVDDLHAFAPEDPVATAVVARLVLGHGAAKLDDLRP